MTAKKCRRSGQRATAGRKLARREPTTPTPGPRLAEAETLAKLWLHVGPNGKEQWFKTEPLDTPVMEIAIVRLPDGSHWQLAFRYRIKLHNWLNSERFPDPHGRRWVYVENRGYVSIFARPASANLLKKIEGDAMSARTIRILDLYIKAEGRQVIALSDLRGGYFADAQRNLATRDKIARRIEALIDKLSNEERDLMFRKYEVKKLEAQLRLVGVKNSQSLFQYRRLA